MSKVLKFGGTSVGSAENMKKVACVIQKERSTITVLSAMSGTTDALEKITVNTDNAGGPDEHIALIDMLRAKYEGCVDNLLEDGELLDQARNIIDVTIAGCLTEIKNFRPGISDKVVLAQGELLTTAIFTLYLKQLGIKVQLLNAPDFVVTDKEDKVQTGILSQRLGDLVADRDTYYITQGFICTDSNGNLSNLGRGGSDYSAALFGAAISADEVQIWTDIDGFHNNDPRYVENTYPLRKMSYNEAAELAYFGAKILHPATIQPCKDAGIPVKLKNTLDPDAQGTTISDEEDDFEDFHAVAAKDNITVIRICSTKMLMAYGFLRKVFEVFEQYRTPIDVITTSEVSISLTIDNDVHLDEILEELKPLGKIEVERKNTIVYIIGHLEREKVGLAAKVLGSIGHVPVKMISYGASPRSITLLIDTEYKKETLQTINDELFFGK